MEYSIAYHGAAVQAAILRLPSTLAARYVVLTRRMMAVGPHLGEPQTKALGHGLFELRLKGQEGIARVLFCTESGRRIVMLHAFTKKSGKTPAKELAIAVARWKEIQREKP